MNVARASQLVADLAAAGVREFCVCPGGRNAPLVLALARTDGLAVRYGFEERSTAFFALGRACATGRPVAVVTTSGTAAAELFPAAVEAYYAGVPLVLVTADRPPAYRGTGSPQAIEQVDLFGTYAPTVFDGARADDRLTLDEWNRRQPVHVNVCFDEPLVDGEIPATAPLVADVPAAVPAADPAPVRALLAAARRPLVIVGTLGASDRDDVARFLVRLGAPVCAEAASGLREDVRLAPLALTAGDRGLHDLDCDAVLRIGGVPTTRFWRDLETARRDLPVCSVSAAPFAGLTRGALVAGAPGATLRDVDPPGSVDAAWRAATLERDAQRRARLDELWIEEPVAEPSLVRALSARIPAGSLVYLGNSLPIREWDLAAVREPRGLAIAASRGANGIDGQLSTFMGMCDRAPEHWALVGDLTALYDLAAPWFLHRVATGAVRIVVINNGGGQIFARLSPHAELRNEHGLGFEAWAALWGIPHLRWTSVPAGGALPERCIIELVPDADATARFWRAHDAVP